jgi:hypothetical protein
LNTSKPAESEPFGQTTIFVPRGLLGQKFNMISLSATEKSGPDCPEFHDGVGIFFCFYSMTVFNRMGIQEVARESVSCQK